MKMKNSQTLFSVAAVANAVRYGETGFIGCTSAATLILSLMEGPITSPTNLLQLTHLVAIGIPIFLSHARYFLNQNTRFYGTREMQVISALLKSQRLLFAAISSIAGVIRAAQLVKQSPSSIKLPLFLYTVLVDLPTSACLLYENRQQFDAMLDSSQAAAKTPVAQTNAAGQNLPPENRQNFNYQALGSQAPQDISLIKSLADKFHEIINKSANFAIEQLQSRTDNAISSSLSQGHELMVYLEAHPEIFENPDVMQAMSALMSEFICLQSMRSTLDIESTGDLFASLNTKIAAVHNAIRKTQMTEEREEANCSNSNQQNYGTMTSNNMPGAYV